LDNGNKSLDGEKVSNNGLMDNYMKAIGQIMLPMEEEE
jgi:hypothetical protein